MSQDIFDTPIDPAISGTDLATLLNSFKNAVVSGLSGTTRPTELAAGGSWVDMTNDPTSWSYRIWTGTDDVEVFTIDLTNGVASVALAVDSFIVKKISADTAGAIFNLVKNRIASSGQVLDGDVVGEIRMVGRTNSSGNPVVAKIIWTASDNMTTSVYGGSLDFYSTPDATNTITNHMRLISGLVETIVPHKLNSQVLVSQNVATAATIAQLSGSKVVVEMTGSTATDIQGINSAHDSKLVTIHNRSSAIVTLKHQNGSAAAADRLKLPSSADFQIGPESSATLYYCTTDTFWKLFSTSNKTSGYTVDTLYNQVNSWTAPTTTTTVRVCTYRRVAGAVNEVSGLQDVFGNAYAWGINTNGQLGVGDVTPRSSPVAVLGGLTFARVYGSTAAASARYGISNTGSAYAWGINTNGQLGVAADVVPRSSPVLVLGGLRYNAIYPRDASVFALTTNNNAYAWGINTNGQLGIGSVTPASAPTAVLGGLKFISLVPISADNSSSSVVGLTNAGVAYAWGYNVNGQLGVGDVTVRSSPVAVLGGLTFSEIKGGGISSRYFYVGLTTAGAAYAWGANTSSNLGVGNQTPRSSPVAVLGGLTFSRILTHPKSETVMGLTSTGVLYAWGDNTQGVLGVGDTTNRSSPVAVLGGLTFSKARIFRNVAFGLTTGGVLYSWGVNTNGQLGVGDVTSRSSPVAVLGGLTFSDVFFPDGISDTYSIYGITTDGLLYSWGINANGTLGLGDVTPRSSPVAVLGGFAPDPTEPSKTLDLTVVGGTTYTIVLGSGIASFGANLLGRDIHKIEIEYLQ